MLKNSQLFTNAIKDDVRRMHARVTINNIVYDESVINSIDFQSSALSGEQFEIGSTHAATVKVEFSEVIETITALDKVIVEIGVKREEFPLQLKNKTNIKVGRSRMGTRLNLWNSREDIEYSLLGEFYISDHVDINYNDKITTIECKDKIIYLEDTYESNLNYPADIRTVITEIANMAGVEIDTLNIEQLEPIEIKQIENASYRESLGFIAQLIPGFVYFNHKGLLQIRSLVDSEYQISTDEYYSKGLQKNGIRYKVRGITCTIPDADETEVLFVGSKKGPQITIENPIMTQSLLEELFDRLQEIDYYPFDLNWRGNPALEIGDLITVFDAEGHELKVPNLNYRLQYNGGLSAESGADTKSRTDIVPSGRVPLQQQIHNTNRNIKESATKLESAFKNAQDRITGNQGGYIIQRMNEDGKPYEFLVMDTEDINSATNVIRLNQQGIGFSQNGYNGPFGVAITIDGQIVADYITAGTLSAELIQSGFNKITAGTSITQEGIKQVDASGEYAVMAGGGLRFYTSNDTLNGSIESSYYTQGGSYTGETGVGIFIQPGRKFSLIRNIDGVESNVTILDVPTDKDELRLRRDMDAYGRNIYDANIVGTRNDINVSVLRTWLTGEAFVGGSTGTRLGYIDGTTYQSRMTIPKSGSAELYAGLDMRNNYLYNVREFVDDNGHYFTVSRRRKLDINSSGLVMHSQLNMNTHTIINQSDVRLKLKVNEAKVNALKEIDRLEFIEWEWDKEKRPDSPDGVQFGIKAQYAPFLQTKAQGEESYLSLDMNKHVSLNSKAIQELYRDYKSLEERVKELEGA